MSSYHGNADFVKASTLVNLIQLLTRVLYTCFTESVDRTDIVLVTYEVSFHKLYYLRVT